MEYQAINIAKRILHHANEKNIPLSNLHLQKVLYYAQGFHYAFYHDQLFTDDIQAWKYGPVVPYVYSVYRGFAGDYIVEKRDSEEKIDERTDAFLKIIVTIVGKKDPWALVETTHKEAPWKESYRWTGNNVIPKEKIKEFFEAV